MRESIGRLLKRCDELSEEWFGQPAYKVAAFFTIKLLGGNPPEEWVRPEHPFWGTKY